MSTAMERYEQPLALIQSIDDLARLSQSISKSGYYKDVSGPEQVGVKLMVARELGLGINAISFIYPVKGKITLGYQILIALVKRSGKYDMRIRERSEKCCRIEWFERNDEGKLESVGFSQYTPEDAKRAGLLGNPNYTKNPIEMLVARATSSGFNSYTPECGGGGLYSIGELDEEVSAPAPRPIATPRTQMASTEATLPDTEIVVDAELEEVAPVTHPSAEDDPGQASEQAASSGDPLTVLAELLRKLKPEHRRVVKGRTTLLGIKWDKDTPAALVAHFGDDHDGLMAHLAEPKVEAEITEPTADTPEEFEAWLTQQHADEKQRQGQLARAGTFGVKS